MTLVGVGGLLMAIFCKCKNSNCTTGLFIAGGVGCGIAVMCVLILLSQKKSAAGSREEWLYKR